MIKNFLSDDERKYLMKEAEKNMETSTVTNGKKVDENVRKSQTAWLTKDDPIVRNVMERCLEYTDRPLANCEKLQVLKYKPGGFYKPHHNVWV